jgi:hypothetical protein
LIGTESSPANGAGGGVGIVDSSGYSCTVYYDALEEQLLDKSPPPKEEKKPSASDEVAQMDYEF